MCLFCKIINKGIPSDIVYEDDKVLAFRDINPQAAVHILIVPKVHIENVRGITDKNSHVLVDIHNAANEVAKKVGVYDKGYRLITNCGEDAGQTVMHMHYHLLGGEKLGEKIL